MTLTLNKPSAGTQNWDVPVNENWETLEDYIDPDIIFKTDVSGTVVLDQVNKVYLIKTAGNITFQLPEITDTTKHYQIKVFLHMPTAVTVNWSTDHYLNGYAPDLVAGGYHLIYFDFLPNANVWAVGGMGAVS